MNDIAAMLPAAPTGAGYTIDDRPAWNRLAALEAFQSIVSRAETLAGEPVPDQPDDLYLDYSKTGNRTRFQTVTFKRNARLSTLALAECLDNRGRFIPPLEEMVAHLCRERTWVLPAHDPHLANFHGTMVDIDLHSAGTASELATIAGVFGGRLSPDVQSLIREQVRQRIFDPFRDMVEGRRKANWWTTCQNNWNSVCLAGVVGAALAIVESREERAWFIQTAEQYIRNFLKGFGPDGYCSEGVGYWNYGFGHFILLAENVYRATKGGLDWLDDEAVRQPATFGARMEIMNGIYPAFADASVNVKPSPWLMDYLNRRLKLGLNGSSGAPLSPSTTLFHCLLIALPNAGMERHTPARPIVPLESRTWFDPSGVLISRPGSAQSCRLAVALKGGHNGEMHNHNDVGSYVVAIGREAVLLDPGAEIYTARTFSPRRYESKVLNSYGHPVPVVAGQLQRAGAQARGQVLKAEFTDTSDTLVLDIRSAYEVADLKRLVRTLVYSRSGPGSLTVTDEVEFSEPREFETALITLGDGRELEPGCWRVSAGEEALRVAIRVEGSDFSVASEQIQEDVPAPTLPRRIGIRMKQPVTRAVVSLTITPEP